MVPFRWLCTLVCLCVLLCAETSAQGAPEKLNQDPCVSKTTCSECIQTPTCAWCFQKNFTESKRCFQPNLNSNMLLKCDEKYVINPDNLYSVLSGMELTKGSRHRGGQISGATIETQDEFTHEEEYLGTRESGSSFHGRFGDPVQISPQHVKLQLRINQAYHLKMQYAQAEDYPVDLYYLMDLSKSMEDDKSKLSALGSDLATAMKKITSNFRLGFGSFVDKVVMPYVSTVPRKLESPCENCAKAYGFRNHMSLSDDTTSFSVSEKTGCSAACLYVLHAPTVPNIRYSWNEDVNAQVQSAAVSGNLDAPEGGFDAIMQAVVCRREIGWREKARRLLVFSTDAGFHYAGDGKLGGIVKPNDGLCHLDSSGLYDYSSIQDYPSISQINHKVKENAINVIFAVTQEQHKVYQKLQAIVEGASSGILSNDSSNVVTLVQEQYDKISSSVEMKDNSTSAVKVTYYSSCIGGPSKQTNKCDGLKVGTVVQFTAVIEVTKCPADRREWTQTFQIYPVGINESLVVELEMICDCPCENPGHEGYQERSEQCSGFGTYKCGICECDSSHFGRNCECDSTTTLGERDKSGCRSENATVDCSGRGACVCGVCECETRPNQEEVISGRFCECDNFSCDRQGGLLCSGEDHGVCDCGKCKCNPGWTGSACDCRASIATCIAPGANETCSGKGECECGVCKCIEGPEGRYSGRYCDKCPTCPGRCLEFKECVQCQVYKTGKFTEAECAANCTFVPSEVEVVEPDEEKDESLCAYYDEDGCRFAYVYSFDETGKVVIRAQKERECKGEVRVLGIVLGVIGAIVLIGLALLLLWKLLTTITDRREFAKFEKERMMAKWDAGENPIYKQATSTFKNPTYAGK